MTEDKIKINVTFKDENGGDVDLIGKKEILLWLKEETDFWSWLYKGDGHYDRNAFNVTRNFFNQIISLKTEHDNYKNSDVLNYENIKGILTNLTNNDWYHSDSKKASIVKHIFENEGIDMAIPALAVSINQGVNMNLPKTALAVNKYSIMLEGLSSQGIKAIEDSFDKSRRRAIAKFTSLNRKAEGLADNIEDRLTYIDRATDLFKKWALMRWGFFKEKKQKDVNDEIDKLNNVNKTYTEHMNISAPVDYWQKKSEDHFDKSKLRRNILLVYTVIVPISILFIVENIWEIISDPNKSSYIILGLIIFITSILFWAGRILVRLYLSELHLGIDAQERAVMAKTYLALINENQVEKVDREILLNALFRPTADGIIKDDAAPNFTPSSVLSRRM